MKAVELAQNELFFFPEDERIPKNVKIVEWNDYLDNSVVDKDDYVSFFSLFDVGYHSFIKNDMEIVRCSREKLKEIL